MEKSFIKSIELSFNKANKGQEQLNIIIYWWGFLAYLIAYFILNKIIFLVDIKTIDILVSILACIYFIWHIFVLHKCKPKKPDLSDEEKKKIELERKKEMPKKIIRKIFLREPIFKWNIISVITAVDLFAVAHFSGYFFR